MSRALDGAFVERGAAGGDVPDVALRVKWIGAGWPADVRRAAALLPRPLPANLVFVARELSPGALERLEQHDANWADATGRARIVGPGGLIVIREPARRRERGSRRFRWSDSALSLAELLLARPRTRLRVDRLATESGWSSARVGMAWAGLEIAAPYMSAVPTRHIYDFAGPLTDAIRESGLREVEEGARVVFWSADRQVLDLATREHQLPVVSAPRLYADLLAFGGRGQDAA